MVLMEMEYNGPVDMIIRDCVLIRYRGKEPNVRIPEGILKIGEKAFFKSKSW